MGLLPILACPGGSGYYDAFRYDLPPQLPLRYDSNLGGNVSYVGMYVRTHTLWKMLA